MKVIISGSRYATLGTAGKEIQEYIDNLPENTTIIHGKCKGVDMIADYYARKRGLKVVSVDAEWKKYGKAAGPIRNKKMLDLEPDLVVLFHHDLENSKGTLSMKTLAQNRNVETIYIEYSMTS